MEYTYDQMFQRNNGIFNDEERKRIKNLRVAIAGIGTLGGELAQLLVRLGVTSIKLCDPEDFEISNINRQFGCYIDTIGQNKAIAVSKELLRINPNLNVEVWDYGINSSNVNNFVSDCDLVIDAIEFYSIIHSIELQDEAREQNKWVMTSQLIGSMASTMNIKPGGPNIRDLYFENGNLSMEKVINTLFPILPVEATEEMVEKVINGEKLSIPSWSHASIAIVLVMFEDIVRYFIKNDMDLLTAPSVTLMDLYKKEFIIKNV